MSEKVLRVLAKPMCCTAALIWGTSFVVMKNALDDVSTFFLLAFRFSVAAVLLALVFWKKWRIFTRDYIWRGAVIGGMLFLAYTVQTFGLTGTTPSKNAFLTSVYCVLVPFFYWAAARRRPDRYNIIAAFLCVTGVGFVSLNGGFSIAWGDWLTLLSAVFYAAHIVSVAKLADGKDIYLITIFQFAWAGVYAWLGVLFTGGAPGALSGSMVFSLMYLAVMATSVALLFQNVGQVHSDPASASVLLSLESVFGVIFSVIFYGDPVTPRLVLGFGLIFVAVVCSETKFSFLRRKKTAAEDGDAA